MHLSTATVIMGLCDGCTRLRGPLLQASGSYHTLSPEKEQWNCPPSGLERLRGKQPIRGRLQEAASPGPEGPYKRNCGTEQEAVSAWSHRSKDGVPVWLKGLQNLKQISCCQGPGEQGGAPG